MLISFCLVPGLSYLHFGLLEWGKFTLVFLLPYLGPVLLLRMAFSPRFCSLTSWQKGKGRAPWGRSSPPWNFHSAVSLMALLRLPCPYPAPTHPPGWSNRIPGFLHTQTWVGQEWVVLPALPDILLYCLGAPTIPVFPSFLPSFLSSTA